MDWPDGYTDFIKYTINFTSSSTLMGPLPHNTCLLYLWGNSGFIPVFVFVQLKIRECWIFRGKLL